MFNIKTTLIGVILNIVSLFTGCASSRNVTAELPPPSDGSSNASIEEPIEKAEAFLTIDRESSLKKESNGAFYIYGETSANCSSINVQASNEETGLLDNYQLEEYSYGDTTFRYGIREDWSNLSAGLNQYSIIAYCDDNQVIENQAELSYTPPPTPIVETMPSFDSVYVPTESHQYQSTQITSSSKLFDSIDYLYQNEASLIVECDDEYVFLGKIAGKYDSDSIFDKYGDYGSKYDSSSIWDKYGDYGSKYSNCSPFDKYSSSPPMILIGDSIVGHLSMNKYAGSTVISPNELLLYAYQKFDDDHWLDLIQD